MQENTGYGRTIKDLEHELKGGMMLVVVAEREEVGEKMMHPEEWLAKLVFAKLVQLSSGLIQAHQKQ